MINTYSLLIGTAPNTVAETSHSYNCLTERHIQAIWLEQKYFKGLKTSSGLPIRVISPGIWNAEAGPDFLKAHLEIGGTVVKGDVEIHLSEQSWYSHHHHLDSKYNQVVFHLCLWTPKEKIHLETASGQHFHRAYLENYLTVPVNQLIYLIDTDLYPYRKFIGSGQCAHQLFKILPENKIETLFSDAATWRLQKKNTFLKIRSKNPRHWAGIGVAMALGYKNNANEFAELYLWLCQQNFYDERTLFAIALKACGFFNPSYLDKWGSCEYYQELFSKLSTDLDIPVFHLKNFKIRPFNHPVRRLAYLAKFISDYSHFSLKERLLQLWEDKWITLDKTLTYSKMRELFQDLLPSYEDPFWNHKYIFNQPARKEKLSLSGNDIKQRIVVNTFFPLLHEEIQKRGDHNELAAFKSLYGSFFQEGSSKSQYLVHRFFGESLKGRILERADMEQGAYQIHHDFCIHYEASCDGCPFVQRVQLHYH